MMPVPSSRCKARPKVTPSARTNSMPCWRLLRTASGRSSKSSTKRFRDSRMRRIVLASNNAGKLREIRAVLAGCGVELLAQKELDVPDADETGLSFVENALIKARHASELTSLPSLADDSGIEVDTLHGMPGIYSARYARVGA